MYRTQNINSPIKQATRQSEVPIETIIRQVATPNKIQQLQNPIIIQKNGMTYGQPIQIQNGSKVVINQVDANATQFRQTNINTSNVPDLPLMPPIRRIQYVPYEQRYIEYVQQRVKVPVQKTCTDYYQIEHIVDYVPIQKEQIIYQVQPKEVVTMKLQYVPVQQKIIHISDKNAQVLGITNYKSTDIKNTNMGNNSLFQEIKIPNDGSITVNQPSVASIKRSRTNFVTSDGYDPQANLQQIDNILSSSQLRASGAKIQQ